MRTARAVAVSVAAAVAVACVFAPAASAHARPLRSEPADGAVLGRAPAAVRVVFDDTVEPASGITAIRNGGGSVLAGRATVSGGRTLVIPLRPHLADGDYSVLWAVLSDDGHVVEGVLAFAIGAGRAPPSPQLAAGGGPGARDVASRWLLALGVLLAFGAVAFRFATGVATRREVLLVGFLLVLAGAATAVHAGTDTRFGKVTLAALVVAAVGAAASVVPVARRLAELAALALVVTPTLRGHALDAREPRALSVPADLAHVAAAAVWLGGLVSLALALPGLEPRAVRRFSALALGSVALLAATGLARTLVELSSVSELWSTGYGRAILVKSGLLAGLVALGRRNRYRLLPALSLDRLRRSVLGEIALVVGAVVAVAVLTDLRPGRAAPAQAVAASAPDGTRPAPTLARGALTLARQAGELAVGLAVRPLEGRSELTATVLGQSGGGVEGLRVSFSVGAGEAPAQACGPGCYRAEVGGRPRAVTVRLGDRDVRFALPASWSPAAGLVRRAERAVRRLRSLVTGERLASRPGTVLQTIFTEVAPDRLAYRIAGGSQAIVIGARRWDRDPGGQWHASEQSPLSLPGPDWTPGTVDAQLLGVTAVGGRRAWLVSMADPTLPAWFTVALDRKTLRPLELHMIAAAHFMHLRYRSFDAPLSIEPPPR